MKKSRTPAAVKTKTLQRRQQRVNRKLGLRPHLVYTDDRMIVTAIRNREHLPSDAPIPRGRIDALLTEWLDIFIERWARIGHG